jgi:hypothetical protein
LHAADVKPITEGYCLLIASVEPEVVPYPEGARVRSNRHLIRHLADVPVLLSAMDAGPDWLLTHKTND